MMLPSGYRKGEVRLVLGGTYPCPIHANPNSYMAAGAQALRIHLRALDNHDLSLASSRGTGHGLALHRLISVLVAFGTSGPPSRRLLLFYFSCSLWLSP